MDKEFSEALRLTLEKEVAAIQKDIDAVQTDAGATPYSQRTAEWKINYIKQIDEYLRKMEATALAKSV